MVIHDSCQSTIQSCLTTKTFAIAQLNNGEHSKHIHIHDCCEIYFCISGGGRFLIDDRVYELQPGDIFFINQFESHYLSQMYQKIHEWVVVSIWPEYLRQLSTSQTDLNYCFVNRNTPHGHRLSLSEGERNRFMDFILKFSEDKGFGQDVLDQAVFLEMMTFLNHAFIFQRTQQKLELIHSGFQADFGSNQTRIDGILCYINQHLTENLSISTLASHFYLSSSYLCKIFKVATGTTINRYITTKRIARAKALLVEGYSVAETCNLCGYGDYSNFLKSFSRIVGVSPKKYVSSSKILQKV